MLHNGELETLRLARLVPWGTAHWREEKDCIGFLPRVTKCALHGMRHKNLSSNQNEDLLGWAKNNVALPILVQNIRYELYYNLMKGPFGFKWTVRSLSVPQCCVPGVFGSDSGHQAQITHHGPPDHFGLTTRTERKETDERKKKNQARIDH